MWAESQPGPSKCRPGYCTYCRVVYNDLDQHLASLRHLDCVRESSRGSVGSTRSFADSSQAKGTLLERFLQDVLLHHPHCYNDPRPSDADLPSVCVPLTPREELDEVCFSGDDDDDDLSLGTRERLPSSDDNVSTNQEEDAAGPRCQLEKRLSEGAGQARPSTQGKEQEEARTVDSRHTTVPKHRAPLPARRKAHGKIDRRKTSEPPTTSDTRPSPPSVPQAWHSWRKERWAAFKEEAFGGTSRGDLVDQTIEEVIQTCCHGDSWTSFPLEETGSFHASLPRSLQTQSDWDSPGQVDSRVPPVQTPLRDFSHLTDVRVDLTDQVYSHQLESVLRGERRPVRRGVFRTGPREVPESFKGKTWSQIEEEDEKKVDDLVRQFRRGRFVCYFDSESLARCGTRSKNVNGPDQTAAESDDVALLPLLDRDEEEVPRRRDFRMASRCQVVKVSHATQTVRLVVPTVCQPALEATPTRVHAGDRPGTKKTPEAQWSRLPPSYSPVITPLQPSTSLVYLLCSPTFPGSAHTAAASPASKRSRKRQRPPDFHRQKVKYKQLPLRFYDHRTNRIIKNPPKSFKASPSPAASNPLPPCVRQLFRSLSPDLNAERRSGEGGSDSPRGKNQKPSSAPGTDSARTRKRESSPPVCRSRSEEPRIGSDEKPRPPKRRVRVQTAPPPPRRCGLRRKDSAPLSLTEPNLRRGRSQRRRCCVKTPK
ncbi:DBF4-type zinc finger-containing protein 2 isoform X2 [Hippocampus zosterae]|uniref:DBF4-type zinc finger-containing protein 2 isoform X2 n=1 Tax=Hippocampus zosterae TaxID=109293 RepID=UPI00223E23CD|nr:DBF4-type zinc finger-containing protein 2 isoform X2 [Hippocampus zosterae]XP_051910602.1 DBF4-type zinc finger-containing protein 2 isoform X2 [Hippocampus zosterae]